MAVLTAKGLTADPLNNIAQVDGVHYPFTTAGIQSAIVTACNGSIPGQVVLSPGRTGQKIPMTAGLSPPSGCTISGPGKDKLVLQASSEFKGSAVVLLSGVSQITLEGFGIDGNREGGVSGMDGIDLYNSPSHIVIQDVTISNFAPNAKLTGGFGIGMNKGGSHITIRDADIYRNGAGLSALHGAGIGLTPGTSILADVKILNSRVHDNTNGIYITPGSSTGALVEDIVIADRTATYSNAGDGIAFFGFSYPSGIIRGPRVENVDSFCNGWPANGVGFSTSCVAGFFQNGPVSSSTGVGIDINSTQIIDPVVVGNRTHDNVYDGISLSTQVMATVNTSGMTLTCSGCGSKYPPLSVGWKSGQWIKIGGNLYQLSLTTSPPCSSATTCTLQRSAGGARGAFLGPTWVHGTVSGNVTHHNGNSCCGGTGIYIYFSDGNTITGNTASFNALGGISSWASSFNMFTGNTAISNNQSNHSGNRGGFVVNLGLKNSFLENKAEDRSGPRFQLYGLIIGTGSTSTYVDTQGLTGPRGAILDSGTGTRHAVRRGPGNN